MTSAFGFILVLVKCYFSRSVAGISLKSIQCYVVVYALRVLTVTKSKAYLPYDSYALWDSFTEARATGCTRSWSG